jgi:3-methyladenine DNA glycosylase/8-oxoguanine DNA glycosylase
MPTRAVTPPHPVDLRLTLGPLQVGRGDPTLRLSPTEAWRASRTPDGPVTLHLRAVGRRFQAEAWGPGAGAALEAAPDLLGCTDDTGAFRPGHRLLRDLHRRHPGLRLGRAGPVTEVLVRTILGQKVTGIEQKRGWRRLVRAHGEPAPGPAGLLLPPAPPVLAALPYHRFHPLGVERRRADTIRRACARAGRVEEAAVLRGRAAERRLTALAGVGPWTAAIVARLAFGDPDAVEVGDYHVPDLVAWNLGGQPRADDARMLELLEPFRGHRGRVVRLLQAGGRWAPKFGPRMPLRRLDGR